MVNPQLPAPTVSVVIATYRRVERLETQLDAVLKQETDFPFEVIVVDDASGDGTVPWLRSRSALDERIRVIERESNGGPARARNDGIAAARGSVVAMTDDDCAAQPGWLEAIATPILVGDVDLVQGRTIAEPITRRDRWTHSISVSGPNRFETCNIAYRRSLLDELDGFDGTFRNAEDADLGNRALDRGARFAFVADAVVEHARLDLDLATLLRRRRLASALARVARRHPRFRDQLWAGIAWRRGHVLVLGGVGAVALAAIARRPLIAGLVALIWSAREARPYRDASPLRRLGLGAGIALADVVEVGATIEGAVRERTLIL